METKLTLGWLLDELMRDTEVVRILVGTEQTVEGECGVLRWALREEILQRNVDRIARIVPFDGIVVEID